MQNKQKLYYDNKRCRDRFVNNNTFWKQTKESHSKIRAKYLRVQQPLGYRKTPDKIVLLLQLHAPRRI